MIPILTYKGHKVTVKTALEERIIVIDGVEAFSVSIFSDIAFVFEEIAEWIDGEEDARKEDAPK